MALCLPAIIFAIDYMLTHRCHHIGIMVIVTSMLPYWYDDYGPHRQCCLWQTQITGTHQWPLDRHGCIWQAPSEVRALFIFCFVLFLFFCHELGEGHWDKDQEQPSPTVTSHIRNRGKMGWIQWAELLSESHLLGEVSLSCRGENEIGKTDVLAR